MRKLSLVLFLFVVICSLAAAEKYALLVGINDYQGEISPLRYCVADVEAFSQALVETAGFNPDNVYLMTSQMSGRKEPTHVNVIRQLSLLSERVKSEDTFIFYFSGHGITKAGQSFLLTTNSDTTTKDTLTITAVDLNQVNQILSRIQAQQLLTVIDACRNDPDSGRGEQDNLLTRGFKVKRQRTADADPSQPSVSATLYACNVGERAYEWPEKQHGVFSYYLLEGLNGKATNSKGEVVVTDLANYTGERVAKWAQTTRGKKQTPWLDLSGGSRFVLVENQLGVMEEELSQLRSDQALIQQQLEQAQQSNSLVEAAEAKQRLAEQQDKVRQAKKRAKEERLRQQALERQQEEAERERQEQLLRDAEVREEARKKQAEIERQKQRLEAERQKLQAQQLESMDVGQLLQKAKELQDKIDQVGPEVRADVTRQISSIPKPQKTSVEPQDEFETQAMYEQRLNKAREADKEREQRYQREVGQIRGTISSEIKSRSQGYQEALSLLSRDMVLDETQVVLDLGRYDPENQVFADASLSAKSGRQIQSFDWELKAPLNQAKQFKQSVENGTVKIRAQVKLDADRQQAVIASAMVEDLVQNLSYQTPIMVMVTSRPKGGQVWVNGGQEGETPLKVRLAIGSNRVEVKFKGTNWRQVKSVEVKEGPSSRGNFDFDFGTDSAPRIVGQDGAEMVLIPAGPSISFFYMDVYEVSNAQYGKFMRATGHGKPGYWDDADYNQSNQPVAGVSWHDATAYAKWAGKRLPGEKEWEWAARGGLKGKEYPWGSEDPNLSKANYDYKAGKLTAVGSYPANGYGLYDMAGNVSEWCQDWYSSDQEYRVLRGGSWSSASTDYLRVDVRDSYVPNGRGYDLGFRCVSDLP